MPYLYYLKFCSGYSIANAIAHRCRLHMSLSDKCLKSWYFQSQIGMILAEIWLEFYRSKCLTFVVHFYTNSQFSVTCLGTTEYVCLFAKYSVWLCFWRQMGTLATKRPHQRTGNIPSHSIIIPPPWLAPKRVCISKCTLGVTSHLLFVDCHGNLKEMWLFWTRKAIRTSLLFMDIFVV